MACNSGRHATGNRSVQTEHTANVQQTQSHSKKNDEKFLLSDFHQYHFDTLIDELHENALRAEKNHNGEYVLIEGYLCHVDIGGKYFGLNGGPYDTYHRFNDVISCRMSEEYLVNTVMDFNNGDRLAVFGKVVAAVASDEAFGYCVETIEVITMGDGMTLDDIMAMAKAQAHLEQLKEEYEKSIDDERQRQN